MVNIWVIIIAMVLSLGLGMFWYGPLFGKKWMELSGIKMPDEKPSFKVMLRPMMLSVFGAVLMTFVLSFSIGFHNAYYGKSGILPHVLMAIFLWIGFIVPPYLNNYGWEGKPKALFFINAGYWLVFLILLGAIISAFGA